VRNTHLFTGILLIPVCIYCLFWLIPNNTVPPTSEHDISPALIPSIAVAAGLLLSALMAFKAWRTRGRAAAELDDEFGEEATGIDAAVLTNAALWSVAAAITWALTKYVGFEPAMAVLMLAVMLYIGVRRPTPLIGTAIVMPIVLSQAAWYFFTTEMPGIWR